MIELLKAIVTLIVGVLALIAIALSLEKKSKEEALSIVVTDGCEYLKENGCSTHKGNCKNPIHYFKDVNQYKYVISLPEEYALISADNLHPDTLTAYVSRDTLYIQFFNKRKP